MNTDIIKGQWHEVKGDVKKSWGRLTDDDIAFINGDREKLSGRLQKAYGVARDEAERQIKDWEDTHTTH
jgi:uncharacterized protein YjbJ (UPF0337 family)